MPKAKENLTDRQIEVLDIIKRLIAKKGYPPSIREIGAAAGIVSLNGVVCHVEALERKGYIARDRRVARSICIVEGEVSR